MTFTLITLLQCSWNSLKGMIFDTLWRFLQARQADDEHSDSDNWLQHQIQPAHVFTRCLSTSSPAAHTTGHRRGRLIPDGHLDGSNFKAGTVSNRHAVAFCLSQQQLATYEYQERRRLIARVTLHTNLFPPVIDPDEKPEITETPQNELDWSGSKIWNLRVV
ncbi:hypothetical protein QCA50_008593 [Cerrena zonata]|uniref:Uncharacterized protein n=1 Tax=Cerrena zonata TaxID=2478898 RepID=A0AAW0G3E3_9APHY